MESSVFYEMKMTEKKIILGHQMMKLVINVNQRMNLKRFKMLDRIMMSSKCDLDGCEIPIDIEIPIASFMVNLKISINGKYQKQKFVVNVNMECYYNETKRLCIEES